MNTTDSTSGNTPHSAHLRLMWEEHKRASAQWSSATFLNWGEKAISEGQATLAYDILQQGMAYHPDNPTLQYRAALALANCGSFSPAQRLIDALLARSDLGTSLATLVFSLSGRLAKERFRRLKGGGAQQKAAKEASESYLKAYRLNRDPFPGVNAATMSLLVGNGELAEKIAEEVYSASMNIERSGGDHWNAATLGEAALVRGKSEDALKWYELAAKRSANQLGDRASMWRQLKMLADHLSVDPAILKQVAPSGVAVFVGHMIDAPDRAEPRFPASLEKQAAELISKAIDDAGCGIGYTSLACGGDILFVEAMLARGHAVHIVFPFQKESFIETSVSFAGEQWVTRFNHCLERAESITYAVEEPFWDEPVLFPFNAQMVEGMAVSHARRLEIEPVMIALVAPQSMGKPGGALESVERWQRLERNLSLIELPQPEKRAAQVTPSKRPEPKSPDPKPPTSSRQVRTMMFADMVGFSRLTEAHTRFFHTFFLGAVHQVLNELEINPEFQNTWGDGLFLVFKKVENACHCALRLRRTILDTKWPSVGLPEETSIRIGMHTGPVLPGFDPIIGRENFFGSQVNRAARIEPVAAPGSVFVSEQTAALLAAEGNERFVCEYLGEKLLPKGFGSSRLYRLRDADELE